MCVYIYYYIERDVKLQKPSVTIVTMVTTIITRDDQVTTLITRDDQITQHVMINVKTHNKNNNIH